MRLMLHSMKRQMGTTISIAVFYVAMLLLLIVATNSNSMIYYKISPYAYASEMIDFFFALIVSIPFSYCTFFIKKNGFLEYASLRISKKKYLCSHFVAMMLMCFLMIFFVNMIGVLFSCSIASVTSSEKAPTLANYILGELQMNAPLKFGALWSLQKAFIGMMICLFAQIIALYVENMFLALCIPFIYVLLENFLTSVLKFPEFSLSTTFILNRLTPSAMRIGNIITSLVIFILVMIGVGCSLRGYHERKR